MLNTLPRGHIVLAVNQSATASASFTLCAALGTTRYGTAVQPELHAPGGATLNFNLYTRENSL